MNGHRALGALGRGDEAKTATLLLLVRKRATTGAMTAASANAILTQLESLHAE